MLSAAYVLLLQARDSMATILYYLVYYPLVLLVEKLWYILGVIVAPFVHFARMVLYLATLPLLLRRLVEVS